VGKRDDYYAKSTYFGADEMAGRTLKLTIAAVEDTEFETDSKTVLKPVLTFRNQQKKLVVGAMNYDRLADVFGDETKGWVGRTTVLKGEKVPFRGKRVNSIIAQPVRAAQQSQPTLSAEEEPPSFDDEVPDFAP
jgi:hypothetical protein